MARARRERIYRAEPGINSRPSVRKTDKLARNKSLPKIVRAIEWKIEDDLQNWTVRDGRVADESESSGVAK
jgi:hypothetical protein